jgi:hypothetical protein
MKTIMKIEYKVRPVTRYIVTRFECKEAEDGSFGNQGASTQHGVFDSGAVAYEVAYALCRREHELSGQPIDSVNYRYPNIPEGVSVPPQMSCEA